MSEDGSSHENLQTRKTESMISHGTRRNSSTDELSQSSSYTAVLEWDPYADLGPSMIPAFRPRLSPPSSPPDHGLNSPNSETETSASVGPSMIPYFRPNHSSPSDHGLNSRTSEHSSIEGRRTIIRGVVSDTTSTDWGYRHSRAIGSSSSISERLSSGLTKSELKYKARKRPDEPACTGTGTFSLRVDINPKRNTVHIVQSNKKDHRRHQKIYGRNPTCDQVSKSSSSKSVLSIMRPPTVSSSSSTLHSHHRCRNKEQNTKCTQYSKQSSNNGQKSKYTQYSDRSSKSGLNSKYTQYSIQSSKSGQKSKSTQYFKQSSNTELNSKFSQYSIQSSNSGRRKSKHTQYSNQSSNSGLTSSTKDSISVVMNKLNNLLDHLVLGQNVRPSESDESEDRVNMKPRKKPSKKISPTKRGGVSFFVPFPGCELPPRSAEDMEQVSSETTLREVYERVNPNAVSNMQKREVILAQMKKERERRGEIKREWLQTHPDLTGLNQVLPPKGPRVMTVMSDHEMKVLTQRIYNTLGEVQLKVCQREINQERRVNRVMQQNYAHEVQKNTLNGQRNFKHSRSIMRG